ncbi:hypothetical protein ALQ03_100572 [Pseudomonas savastanoi pv. glycinea]|uniref:Uncharacterized protein n=1 Tax=Pseudomonas savastanoi pv. glycinea TaxID=318 RepID=A0A0P9RZU9_PSESG|nr:hypothetical protein ALO37_100507 [Pseudomonas savastanoi pv. glycinea]RML90168.1 hypothetical protein ALQ87_100570 [Pseudomonas savastanoi pv. glycinea]RMM66193.1 hypothetical protein ALQ73_100448 [Pseudomonas savastanoi pv. glycinea]RMM88251.1 hypothetical protein ALQ70_100559 [Pseudomonas savastanoi pv. glycinea]RMO30645.1 hypothetical protein ALQ42_100542 [Pseudomonas savastanoi pv. glycinea]
MRRHAVMDALRPVLSAWHGRKGGTVVKGCVMTNIVLSQVPIDLRLMKANLPCLPTLQPRLRLHETS